MYLNLSTSAARGVWVEIQDPSGHPIPGFALEECHEIVGDELDRVVARRNGSDVSALAGSTVRLRLVSGDADIYALRFQ